MPPPQAACTLSTTGFAAMAIEGAASAAPPAMAAAPVFRNLRRDDFTSVILLSSLYSLFRAANTKLVEQNNIETTYYRKNF